MSKRVKVRSHLLQLVDSDSEDGIGGSALEVARSATVAAHSKLLKQKSNMPPAKKAGAARQPANRVTKPAPKTSTSRRRSSDLIGAAADKATTRGRTAREKKTSDAPSAATARGPGRGRGRTRAAAADKEEDDIAMADAPAADVESPPVAKQKAVRGRPRKAVVEAEPQPPVARRGRKPAGKKTEPDDTAHEVSEIPETQQPDAAQLDVNDDDRDELSELPQLQSPARADLKRSSAPVPSSPSKRAHHTSSSENGDPALRRRLGEMTQKYESLELKYRDLKEVAVREAERNFDRLRKQTEEKSKAADQLIATLKAELAAQKEAIKEMQRLRKQLEASESKADSLQANLTELTTSLSEARSEIKSLSLKLTAARSAEAAATAATAAAKVPGSAIKGASGAAARLAAASTTEAVQQATMAAQKKEDLYGDLTGLIVRSVKRENGEDMFDCIQTGRNGTLHFKLAVDVNADGSGSGSGGEAQCHYTPQLDPSRDRALIAVLPGFLVDDISFPQAQAGKFYSRVLKALNELPESA